MASGEYILIAGLNDAIKQGVSAHYSKHSKSIVETYKGPYQPVKDLYENAKQLIDDSDSTTDDLQLESINGDTVLTITHSVSDDANGQLTQDGDGLIDEFWEIYSNVQYIPILRHSHFIDHISEDNLSDIYNSYPDVLSQTDKGEELYQLLGMGYREFRKSTPVIRHTKIVHSKAKIKASWAQTDKAVSLVTIAPPSAILGAFDGNGYDKNKKQWWTSAPQVRSIDSKKYEIIQEYEYNESLNKILYGGEEEIP